MSTQNIDVLSSTEEEIESEGGEVVDVWCDQDEAAEEALREEAKAWLASHGQKLFALEASKYLAKKNKPQLYRCK